MSGLLRNVRQSNSTMLAGPFRVRSMVCTIQSTCSTRLGRIWMLWHISIWCILTFNFSILMQSHEKLNNECPQCRGEFVGTRNYVVEEMIKQLSILRKSAVKKKDPADEADAIEYDEVKLSEAMAKLITSIPKPSERKPDEDEDNGSDTLSGLWPNMNNLHGETEQILRKN